MVPMPIADASGTGKTVPVITIIPASSATTTPRQHAARGAVLGGRSSTQAPLQVAVHTRSRPDMVGDGGRAHRTVGRHRVGAPVGPRPRGPAQNPTATECKRPVTPPLGRTATGSPTGPVVWLGEGAIGRTYASS